MHPGVVFAMTFSCSPLSETRGGRILSVIAGRLLAPGKVHSLDPGDNKCGPGCMNPRMRQSCTCRRKAT